MRPSTAALQFICVALGVAFFWSAFALSAEVLFGGLLIGSFMFMAGALLGADHASNPGASGRRRLFFKTLAVLATVPVPCVGLYGAIQSADRGQWAEAIAFLLKLAVLAIVLAALVLDSHPIVRRLLRRRGISTPESPSNGQQAL